MKQIEFKVIYKVTVAPTVPFPSALNWDAEPIGELILCKDCKHYDGYYCHNKNWGDGHGNYAPPIKKDDGYCDWAERKEDGKTD